MIDEGLGARGPLMKFPLVMSALLSGMGAIWTPDVEVLSKNKRFPMVRNGNYAELLAKFVNIGILDLGQYDPKASIGLFGV